MGKYLQYIPKTLQEDFINNKVIPLVGAGFSKNANIPETVTVPDWNQLGRKIAEYIDDYEYVNPIDALSLFESEYSRVKLIEVMAKELHINDIKPSETYQAFCNLFFDIICTTNFDFLIEQTLAQTNRPYSVVISEDRLPISIEENTQLIKLHGDFNHPKNMVITERDYDRFVENNKILATYVSNLFITKTLFLVGYSFDDADTRGIWEIINCRLGELNRLAYCVMVGASKTEIARFERRNVKVINLPGKKSEYPKILKHFFDEIKELIDKNTPKRMKATNEKMLEEFALPADESRMCFLSARFEQIPFLKDIIYPIVYKSGLTPVSLDEVVLPEDNWMVKSEAIIKKSAISIVDISNDSQGVMWELTILKKNKKNIILICEEGKYKINPLIGNDSIIRLYNYNDIEKFQIDIENDITGLLEKIEKNSSGKDEAERLIKKNEFDAAIVAVFRNLEVVIRSKCEEIAMPMNKPIKKIVMILLEEMMKEKSLKVTQKEISDFFYIRNEILHVGYVTSKKEASNIVNKVRYLIKEIEEYNGISC